MGAPGARTPPRLSTVAPRGSRRGCANTPSKTARAAGGAAGRVGGAAGRHVARLGACKPGWRGRARDFAILLDRRSDRGTRRLAAVGLTQGAGRVPPPHARGPGWRPRGGALPRLGRDPLTSGGPRASEPLGVTMALCRACWGTA